MGRRGWIGSDLDGTLAHYTHWVPGKIGSPILQHVTRLRRHINDGYEVRIVTARVDDVLDHIHFTYEPIELAFSSYMGKYLDPEDCGKWGPDIVEDQEQRKLIQEWCLEHLGIALKVTNRKDMDMVLLYDDRAKEIVPNTGELVGKEYHLR